VLVFVGGQDAMGDVVQMAVNVIPGGSAVQRFVHRAVTKGSVPKEGRMDQQQRRASTDRPGKTGGGGAAGKYRQSETQALERAGYGHPRNGPSCISGDAERSSEAA
jgi:hypothetical protein